jgi:cytochrome c-type biogenesis protein CcmH/NrfG
LSGARRIFLIDFYFDHTELDRAIASLQRAHENAGDNQAAVEEILWLLGRAHVMRGDYARAAEQYRAILQMQYPGQVRRAEAEKALRDLAAIHNPD